MDRDWFNQRMEARGVNQQRLAEAICLDRTQVSRILAGERELKLGEVEGWAELLEVTPLEILRHAYDWSAPLAEPEPKPDVELLRLAIEQTEAGLRRAADREVAFSGTAAAAYVFLARRHRAGRPIDDRTLEDLRELIAGGFRA